MSIPAAARRPDRLRAAQARTLAKALVRVSDQHPAWTRHDQLKHLAVVMPPETRHMSPEEAQQLLLGLAEETLSGWTGEVVCLEAPEWPPLPASLRRQLDGRSVYTRPGVARYATAAQLTLEDKLVAHAQTQGAPRLPGEVAARRHGADAALLKAQLRGRAPDARGQSAQLGCGWRPGRRQHHPAARRHPTRAHPARLVDRGRRRLHDLHYSPRRARRVRRPEQGAS